MSRYLFVVPPLAGHVNPTVGLGQALAERGHQVAWSGSELTLRPLLGPEAVVYPTGTRLLREQGGHGLAAVRSLWDGFIVPYARFTAKAVDQAVRTYRPDVVIVDQHTPAGALAAHRHRLRWASLASSSMELTRPYRAFPKVEAWMQDRLQGLWSQAGLPADEFVDPRFSPHLVLALTSPALTGPEVFPDHYALVGPVLAPRPAPVDFPWERLGPARRRVLVTMGTLAGDVSGGFYARAVRALGPLGDRVQGIVVAPAGILPGLRAELPENVLAVPQAPILELMGRGLLDAVLCHGGMNTVCESLAHGLPLVIAPIRHDQPTTCAQVVAAGAGLRVRFHRVGPEELGTAVGTVLDEPGYSAAARRVREQFAVDGGAPVAVARLEALADSRM